MTDKERIESGANPGRVKMARKVIDALEELQQAIRANRAEGIQSALDETYRVGAPLQAAQHKGQALGWVEADYVEAAALLNKALDVRARAVIALAKLGVSGYGSAQIGG
jgi:hypothetical protein